MDKPFHNPFEALRGLVDKTPGVELQHPVSSHPHPVSSSSPSPEPRASNLKGPARAVVRMERSGRGGKEVTVISHLGLAPAALETWLKAFKASLGCGGRIEDDTLVLQGDQRPRLPVLLTERGVKKITVA